MTGHVCTDHPGRTFTTLYVAGPMFGLPELNYPAFNAAAGMLRTSGYAVENPADNGGDDTKDYRWYLRAGLDQLLRCDGVAVLEDWWLSGGARWEVQTAGTLGLPVRPVAEWIARACNTTPDGNQHSAWGQGENHD